MSDEVVKVEKNIEPLLNDPDYLDFVKWEGTPSEFIDDPETFPRTMQEFADRIKKTRQTLYNWRKLEGHWARVKEFYDSLHLRKSLEVRNALYKRTQGVVVEGTNQKGETVYKDLPPDTKAIELWLKYEDKWNEKTEVEHSGTINLTAYHLAKRKVDNELKE
jgi:hypothetical protein